MIKYELLFVTLVVCSMFFITGNGNSNIATAGKCEDITGEDKWKGTGHDDNSPSEKKGEKMLFDDNETPCKIAKAIDHMEIDFEITGKKEFKVFQTTFAWEATSEDAQDCIKERFNLPNDDGKPELKAYEYKNCLLGSY